METRLLGPIEAVDAEPVALGALPTQRRVLAALALRRNEIVSVARLVQLITGTDDGALVWNLDTESWADIACRSAGSNLTQAEWDQ